MENLTAAELIVLNNMSQVLNPEVLLGAKLQSLIDLLPSTGTPVNAVNATETLDVTGVVIQGQTVTIDNPAVIGVDVYEFVAGGLAAAGHIPVNIVVSTVKATGTLTVDTQPTSGDTMTIDTKVYTFVPVGTDTADGEISVGADLAAAKLAIVAAINGTDGINDPHPTVTAAAFVADACAITAKIGGAAGNNIATTETFTAVTNVFAAVKLATGADCSAANAITALVAAITASDTQKVGAADGTGDTVVLTADVAGAAGNSIVIGETMANAAFTEGATVLSGGVNGTIGKAHDMLADASYLYILVADNTIADKNWRRITLGSAF